MSTPLDLAAETRRRTLYVVDRLVAEATGQRLRDENVKALASLTRAAGLLRGIVAAETPDANILSEGESVEGFLPPVQRRGDDAGRMTTRQKGLLDRHFSCHDAPVLFPPTAEGNRHTWTAHPHAISKDEIRGYHRLRCAVCGAEGESDTSG